MAGLVVCGVNFALHDVEFLIGVGHAFGGLNQDKAVHPVRNVRRDVGRGAMEHVKAGNSSARFEDRFFTGRNT